MFNIVYILSNATCDLHTGPSESSTVAAPLKTQIVAAPFPAFQLPRWMREANGLAGMTTVPHAGVTKRWKNGKAEAKNNWPS